MFYDQNWNITSGPIEGFGNLEHKRFGIIVLDSSYIVRGPEGKTILIHDHKVEIVT